MKKWVDYGFEFVDEDSDLCGECFFVEVEDTGAVKSHREACRIAAENFPDEMYKLILICTPSEAEIYGWDTY